MSFTESMMKYITVHEQLLEAASQARRGKNVESLVASIQNTIRGIRDPEVSLYADGISDNLSTLARDADMDTNSAARLKQMAGGVVHELRELANDFPEEIDAALLSELKGLGIRVPYARVSSADLRNKLIRLGSTTPELRPHIRPVLAELDKSASRETLGERRREVDKEFAQDVFVRLAPLAERELGRTALWTSGDFVMNLGSDQFDSRGHVLEDITIAFPPRPDQDPYFTVTGPSARETFEVKSNHTPKYVASVLVNLAFKVR